jgi:putative membrane protein
MSNEQLIKAAHGWAVGLILGVAVVVCASQISFDSQNANSSNANQNANANTTKSKNRNDKSSDPGATRSMSNLNQADQKFMLEAAMGGMMEVELGKVAVQKGSSEAIKKFGQRMIDDHSKANSELTALATSKGLTVPTELDAKHKTDVDKLSKLSGDAFDRAYAKEMLKDHTKDVSEFERQSTRAADADLKAFVSKTLPTLKEHLELAKSLNPMGAPGNSNRP